MSMLRTVVVIQRDGIYADVSTLMFEVPDTDFDLKAAVRKAAIDYCKTEDGKETFEDNGDEFNWVDFFNANVPNEFCEKYGFKKVDNAATDIEVNGDENLVDRDDLDEDEAQ